MALFLDVHEIREPVAPNDLAEALRKDLVAESKYQVSYLRRWIDLDRGMLFCLVEAESAEDARSVHLEAHGLVADEIYAVVEYA